MNLRWNIHWVWSPPSTSDLLNNIFRLRDSYKRLICHWNPGRRPLPVSSPFWRTSRLSQVAVVEKSFGGLSNGEVKSWKFPGFCDVNLWGLWHPTQTSKNDGRYPPPTFRTWRGMISLWLHSWSISNLSNLTWWFWRNPNHQLSWRDGSPWNMAFKI